MFFIPHMTLNVKSIFINQQSPTTIKVHIKEHINKTFQQKTKKKQIKKRATPISNRTLALLLAF